MTESDALMQAILDRPDDDAVRLVYADWLEERDDPRSEFIRVQIELRHGNHWFWTRRKLERRADELLRTYGSRWHGPFVPAGCRWRYVRGFVEGLELVKAPDRIREQMARWPRPPRGIVPDAWPCCFMNSMSRLFVRSWDLGPAEARALASSPVLAQFSHLCLTGNRLGASGVEALLASPYLFRLQELWLSGCRPDWPNSQWLPPVITNIGAEGIKRLVQSSLFSQLTNLAIHQNAIDTEAVDVLLAHPDLDKLKCLTVGEVDIYHTGRGESRRALAHLRAWLVRQRSDP